MKNKIFTIILSIVLSLPIATWAVDETSNQITSPVVNQLDEDIIDNSENTYKQPTSKKKIFKKFFAAMGGVAISSFAIFVMLTVYNRAREKFSKTIKTIEGKTSLESPDNIEDSIKVFLEKTNW